MLDTSSCCDDPDPHPSDYFYCAAGDAGPWCHVTATATTDGALALHRYNAANGDRHTWVPSSSTVGWAGPNPNTISYTTSRKTSWQKRYVGSLSSGSSAR